MGRHKFYSVDQISRLMGISENSVWSRISLMGLKGTKKFDENNTVYILSPVYVQTEYLIIPSKINFEENE